jgi:hypothetical protein
VFAHIAAERSGDYRQLFANHRIGCALVQPGSPIAARLAADGWTRSYADGRWQLFSQPPGIVAAATPAP